VSVVHSNKYLIRSTPSQIDFIEQLKLGRVKEAATHFVDEVHGWNVP